VSAIAGQLGKWAYSRERGMTDGTPQFLAQGRPTAVG
jgi:hypothetical protein